VGDAELVAFCRAEYPRLVGSLGLYCGDAAVAEELAQETLARVWTNWKKVSRMDRPEAWAHRVGFNLANSHLRRLMAERRARTRVGPPELIERGPDVAEGHAVRTAVAALPRRQKTALVMRYFLDLSYAEIAELMQTPEPTVRSLTRRGIARLRDESGLALTEGALDVS
jgi:RNA polymerase sigma-70 factor (ECF subfamily)